MKTTLSLLVSFLISFVAADAATSLTFTGKGYITQGQNYYFENITVSSMNPVQHDDIVFSTDSWLLAFNMWSERLHVGMYNNATRWHTGDRVNPTFDIFGDGRGSNQVSGWFNILEIEMNPERNQVIKFAADFMHYSEGMTDRWTSGSLRYNSDIALSPIPEPGPVMISFLSLGLWLRRRRKEEK